MQKGDRAEAMPALDHALKLVRDLQVPFYLHIVTPTVGAAYLLDGRSSAAVELMERALQNDERTKLRTFHSETLVVLSEAVLANRDTGRATHLAERALEVAWRHHQRGFEARVQWLPLNPAATPAAALSRNWDAFVTAAWRRSASMVSPGPTLGGGDGRHRGQGCGTLRSPEQDVERSLSRQTSCYRSCGGRRCWACRQVGNTGPYDHFNGGKPWPD